MNCWPILCASADYYSLPTFPFRTIYVFKSLWATLNCLDAFPFELKDISFTHIH
ncbi:hypothetical protein Hanom_Chr12g01173291 [Helianthus anomalus]